MKYNNNSKHKQKEEKKKKINGKTKRNLINQMFGFSSFCYLDQKYDMAHTHI